MEVDFNMTKQRTGKLDNKEREHRMKNKLCLYCGKPGHRVRECRQKKQQFGMSKTRQPKQQFNMTKCTTDTIRTRIDAKLAMLDLPPSYNMYWHEYVRQLTDEQKQRFWDAAGTGPAALAAKEMIEHAIRSNERGEDWLQATQSIEKANKILVGQMQQLYPDLLEKQEYLEAYN